MHYVFVSLFAICVSSTRSGTVSRASVHDCVLAGYLLRGQEQRETQPCLTNLPSALAQGVSAQEGTFPYLHECTNGCRKHR